MPREGSVKNLPKGPKSKLPGHAKEIYQKAHDKALEEYKSPKKRRGKESQEATAHKVAWAAMKKKYRKTESGQWRSKEE
ncbi:MAG: ChaB family protein [Nitrospirota bacterium]